MPQIYTPHDISLCSNGLRFEVLIKGKAQLIRFQFPPKIKNDSRDGEWEINSTGPNAGDPIALYKHGNPRSVSMEWSYIVDGSEWTVKRIQDQLVTIRRYFVNSGTLFDNLAVQLKIWGMGGTDPFSFRIHSASIKHSDTIVGKGNSAFHLRTDVSAELRSWPLVVINDKGSPIQVAAGQKLTTPDWY